MSNSYKIAFVGNPNVGKSTVFNMLTGLKQHTGNWTGKTVSVARGKRIYNENEYVFTDLPGTYSLFYNSEEEKITSDFLTNNGCDLSIIICDATSLERNLILALQTIEISEKCVVCLNMMDEVKKRKIEIDTDELSLCLGVPVFAISARKKNASSIILDCIEKTLNEEYIPNDMKYVPAIEDALREAEKDQKHIKRNAKRWNCLRAVENSFTDNNTNITSILERYGYDEKMTKEKISYSFVNRAQQISKKVIKDCHNKSNSLSKADKIVIGKYTSFPVMALMLIVVFWITIVGSNYLSDILSNLFTSFENQLKYIAFNIKLPTILSNILINGIYRVIAWVVSVMLPPMMIFFPLFTLLEDVGLLPRLAFNVDHCFQKFNACGKQALTYCMSFGCNAVGVVSTRIIDSKKEKIIAVVTNNFIPCNGRFPILISIIALFFVTSSAHKSGTVICALILTMFIILSVVTALFVSKFISKTLLKTETSSYTLELPPYRKPQICKVLIRSVFDRTLFVLGRAVAVAAPAGLIIWLLSNLKYNNASFLLHISSFLDPFGKLFGLDGVIILSFILGLPANEIVIPIIVMCYMQNSDLTQISNLSLMKDVFVSNGWTVTTAVCVLIFTIMHWPCSTSILTVFKETKSLKWTLLSVFTPTVCGLGICLIINLFSKFFV